MAVLARRWAADGGSMDDEGRVDAIMARLDRMAIEHEADELATDRRHQELMDRLDRIAAALERLAGPPPDDPAHDQHDRRRT